ncbi:MAG: hypothetical protein J5641_05305 [Bacteroidales bacterium]|nr:hypothetical protein [Bacteroidales bacterium]
MLCIFNPEHDLCLANGNRHYVPPASALGFAAAGCGLMGIVYPSTVCCPAGRAGEAFRTTGDKVVVPWGWNLTLKTDLLRQGLPEGLMPSDATLNAWRNLQHRTTLLPLQPYSQAVTTVAEVKEMVARHSAVVLKAPWSGSGRGLRWVTGRLSEQDMAWIDKVVKEQRCIIVEPRWQVEADFALEYRVDDAGLHFVGFSLFSSSNGVYRGNLLLSDEAIAEKVGYSIEEQKGLEEWLAANVMPHYRGVLGVDYILDKDGKHHVSELNLRHTMGLVAHEYLRQHPESEGQRFSPEVFLHH